MGKDMKWNWNRHECKLYALHCECLHFQLSSEIRSLGPVFITRSVFFVDTFACTVIVWKRVPWTGQTVCILLMLNVLCLVTVIQMEPHFSDQPTCLWPLKGRVSEAEAGFGPCLLFPYIILFLQWHWCTSSQTILALMTVHFFHEFHLPWLSVHIRSKFMPIHTHLCCCIIIAFTSEWITFDWIPVSYCYVMGLIAKSISCMWCARINRFTNMQAAVGGPLSFRFYKLSIEVLEIVSRFIIEDNNLASKKRLNPPPPEESLHVCMTDWNPHP